MRISHVAASPQNNDYSSPQSELANKDIICSDLGEHADNETGNDLSHHSNEKAAVKRVTSNDPILTEDQRNASTELRWVDGVSRWLDTKFRIPGTKIRFGADFLLGLVPGAGDLLSLGMSGLLVATMAKNGASAKLVARMLFNVVLDAVVGSVPILGNIFDLFYKANYRNAELMREYYDEGKHSGPVWPIVLAVFGVIGLLLIGISWAIYSVAQWLMRNQ